MDHSSRARTAAPDALRPVGLRVEHRADVRGELGVDEARPLLGWRLDGTGRDRRQSAYRIRLSADGDPTDESAPAMWDTGEVRSVRSHDVAYAGPPLRPSTHYRWAVRLRDEAGRDSGWSAPAGFETGVRPANWTARWIGSPAERRAPALPSLDPSGEVGDIARIRLPSDPGGAVGSAGPVWFATTVELPHDDEAVSVAAVLAGDGDPSLAVNGSPLLTAPGGVVDDTASARLFRAGPTTVTIDAYGPATLTVLARVEVRLRSGAVVVVATDGRWRCGTGTAAGDVDLGDAAGSPRARLAEVAGVHGDPPWGREPISHRPSPYLRRDLELPAEVRRARIRATALGVYELRVNGQRVDGRRLSPGWTDFATRVPYQTHDVTDLLRAGANTIGAVLADGWYAGHLADWGPFQYGDQRFLRLELEADLVGGGTVRLGSDGGWRTATGAVLSADLQNGEVVDARLEPHGWDLPGFDDSGWEPVLVADPAHGALEAETAPPIVVAEELPAVGITVRDTPDGPVRIVDFGQNVVGWVRLRVRGAAGTRLFLRHAEMLDTTGDAPELYTENLRHARCTDEFVLAGDPEGEVCEPRFTVHGFRYCEVIGLPGPLEATDVTAVVAHADLAPTGIFACSDERLNQLHRNIGWGQRGNFLAVPTDCPQRDERMGWTGDAQVFAATAAFGYDVRSFLRKWLRDVRDAQFASGAVPHVAPDLFSKAGSAEADAGGAAGWGDAIVVVPHELARVYGDERAIEENLGAIESWLEYCRSTTVGGLRPDSGFGDWLAVADTPRDLVATAFLAHSARLAAELADRVDRADLSERWRALHVTTRAAFRDRWVRGGGVIVPGTQAAYVLALQFGLFDDAERQRAADRLASEVRSRHWHLTTGFLATPYLLSALSENGHEDVAFRLLTQDSYPSWLYQVVHGDATTIWERWDSWSESRGFQDPSMTSFNHYAYGAVGDWMYRTLGGIEIVDGPAALRFRPRPGGGVTWARAALRTDLGEVRSRWTVTGSAFELHVTVPPGAGAEVVLPTSSAETVRVDGEPAECARQVAGEIVVPVGSGEYSFLVKPLDQERVMVA